MRMQEQMSGTGGSLSIFSKPEYILLFVKHVLDSITRTPSPPPKPLQEDKAGKSLTKEDLRFIPAQGLLSDDDSNDDGDESNVATAPDSEMLETAINLISSILDGSSLHLIHSLFDHVNTRSQSIQHFRQVYSQFSAISRPCFCTSSMMSRILFRNWQRRRDWLSLRV